MYEENGNFFSVNFITRKEAKQIFSAKSRKSKPSFISISNIGNFCYANAIIQALFIVKFIREAIVSADQTGLLNELKKVRFLNFKPTALKFSFLKGFP